MLNPLGWFSWILLFWLLSTDSLNYSKKPDDLYICIIISSMASTFMISSYNFHTYAVIFACTHIFTMNFFKANLIYRATTTSFVSSICTIQLISIWSMELHLQKICLTIAVSDLVFAVYASTVEIDGRQHPIHLCAIIKLNGVKTLFRDLVNLCSDMNETLLETCGTIQTFSTTWLLGVLQ